MAASKKGKKIVGKDDLRRLMREKRNDVKSTQRQIDSPLANLGQLTCALCNTAVKKELLWNAHIQGRTHKENVAALKAKKAEESRIRPPTPPDIKRRKLQNLQTKADVSAERKGIPSDFFDNKSGESKGKASLAIGDYSSSSEEEDDEDMRIPAPAPGSTNTGTVAPGLPSDFFDSGIAPAAAIDDSVKPASMAEKLPEGFFDDPKQDAKVRQVEYRDKMEDQWELFQKTIKEETTVSAQIQEEDDVLAQAERNIDEIDEQLHRWSKVDQLAKKKEELMTKEGEKGAEGENESSDIDEQEFDEFLDWRTKKVWK